METWKLAENPLFGSLKLEMKVTQPIVPEINSYTACNDVVVLHPRRLWWTQWNIEFLTETTFFELLFMSDKIDEAGKNGHYNLSFWW